MTYSSLLLLPLFAVFIALLGTWLDKDHVVKFRSETSQRRHKAKVLIHRWLIVTSLLSTVVVFGTSYNELTDLTQGVILAATMMVPVLVYICIVTLKAPPDTTTKAWTDTATFRHASFTPPASGQATYELETSDHTTYKPATPEQSISQLETPEQAISRPATPEQAIPQPEIPEPAALTRAATSNQLESHDIDDSDAVMENDADTFFEDSGSTFDDTYSFWHIPVLVQERDTTHDLVDRLDSSIEASAGSNISLDELSDIVERLQIENTQLKQDKIELQELVMAQSKVIETEKQRNKEAQIMTQDAMLGMRRAREQERVASESADREQRARKRIEADYATISSQQANATSAQCHKANVIL